METQQVKVTIYDIGVTAKGNCVARVVINGSAQSISINVVDFAKLAAAGVPVVNGGQ